MMGERDVLIKKCHKSKKRKVLVQVLASILTADVRSHTVIVKAYWCV